MKAIVKAREIPMVYPMLMQSIDDPTTVILMSSHEKGVVVTGPAHNIGWYSESWDMRLLRPFTGSITLES